VFPVRYGQTYIVVLNWIMSRIVIVILIIGRAAHKSNLRAHVAGVGLGSLHDLRWV
jgi:hypothetical protein